MQNESTGDMRATLVGGDEQRADNELGQLGGRTEGGGLGAAGRKIHTKEGQQLGSALCAVGCRVLILVSGGMSQRQKVAGGRGGRPWHYCCKAEVSLAGPCLGEWRANAGCPLR